MKKSILILILSLSLIMGFSLAALTAPVTLQWNFGAGEPPTLDPALGSDTTSILVIEQLFLGLTDFNDETMEIVPELATSWEVSEDGLVWAFHMRKDVYWTDGTPVTAHDIEYGVKRTCDPATASSYAYVLYIIRGAKEVNTGEITDLDHIGAVSYTHLTLPTTPYV